VHANSTDAVPLLGKTAATERKQGVCTLLYRYENVYIPYLVVVHKIAPSRSLPYSKHPLELPTYYGVRRRSVMLLSMRSTQRG